MPVKSMMAASKVIISAVATAELACVHKFVASCKAPATSRTLLLSASALQTTQEEKVLEPNSRAPTEAEKQTCKVVKLENRLVSLEKTPPWLVDM